MHKDIAKLIIKNSALLSVLFLLSCNGFVARENSRADDPENFEGTGAGLVYLASPSDNGNSSPDYENNSFSRKITNNTSLMENCSFKQYNFSFEVETNIPCFSVKNEDDSLSTPLESTNGGWTYPYGSDEFYQVSTFYHVKKMMSDVLDSMSFAHQASFNRLFWTLPSATKFDLNSTKAFWLTKNATTETLTVISKCFFPAEDINAFFSPAEAKLCFGYNSAYGNFRFAQDPSVIYHELGHVFVKILLNQRNTFMNGLSVNAIPYQSSLGHLSYDEGGAINEGIADFFSYYMNKKTRFAQWALGVKFRSARPVTESDSLHHANFTATEKLSYPRYVHYDANVLPSETNPDKEALHNAGQITSHYLVALHKEIQNTCTFPANNTGMSTADYKHSKANDYLVYLLSETLAELGDLTTKGSDFFTSQNVSFTNLNLANAFEWSQSVDTITYRKFYKTFAKNIYHNITNHLCTEFSKSHSEALLDQYGLLLFKKYSDEGPGRNIASNTPIIYDDVPANLPGVSLNFNPTTTSAQVDEINRNNSILVSKSLIGLPTSSSGLNTAYLIDSRSGIESILNNLTFQGSPVATSTGLAGVEYNNNNVQISPGEIVGVSLNIVNNSNSPLAGVQVLGNDWDHMKLVDNSKRYVNRFSNENSSTRNSNLAEHRPCKINGWPLISQGAYEDDGLNPGDCDFNSKTNKKFDFEPSDTNGTYPLHSLDAPQPICVVRFADENEEKWVSQNFYRKEFNIDDNKCLNNAISGSSFNPNSCLVRVLPGASQAFYSKLDAGNTLAQTLTQDGSEFVLKSGNLILMEINKETPPGTEFMCRFRARMSNCSDCYSDENGNEYSASDYTSHKPFKVINFSFKVTE